MLRAFVFGPAEILCLTNDELGLLCKFLNVSFAVELYKMITDPEFEAYKNDPRLKGTVERVQEFLLPRLEPIMLKYELTKKNYPMADYSYDAYIKRHYRLDPDSIYEILNTDQSYYGEITEVLEDILQKLPYTQAEYTARTKSDWEQFMTVVAKKIASMAPNLEVLFGLPHNPNFLTELTHNKSYLFDRKIKAENTGLRYLLSKEETIKLILNGFKWKAYCKENNVKGEGKLDFLI